MTKAIEVTTAQKSLFARHISSVLDSASLVQYEDGMTWYIRAADIARRLSVTYALPYRMCVGLIAHLSPQNPWDRNTANAETVAQYLATAPAGSTFERAVYAAENAPKIFTSWEGRRKMIAILLGEDPLDILTSQKVRAFYELILSAGETDSVCVDGHAYNIAHHGMRRVGITEVGTIKPALYAALSEAYRQVGRERGLTGSQVQAITWVVYRQIVDEEKAARK
jgi:hypothetical protein